MNKPVMKKFWEKTLSSLYQQREDLLNIHIWTEEQSQDFWQLSKDIEEVTCHLRDNGKDWAIFTEEKETIIQKIIDQDLAIKREFFPNEEEYAPLKEEIECQVTLANLEYSIEKERKKMEKSIKEHVRNLPTNGPYDKSYNGDLLSHEIETKKETSFKDAEDRGLATSLPVERAYIYSTDSVPRWKTGEKLTEEQTRILAEYLNLDTWIDSNGVEYDWTGEGWEPISGKFLPKCDCGAKHTSNPQHHLSYCSTLRKE